MDYVLFCQGPMLLRNKEQLNKIEGDGNKGWRDELVQRLPHKHEESQHPCK